MALFKNMSITYKGMALYAKAQAGQSIRFTKMQVGSGQIGTQNPATLITLLDKKLDVPITSITANPEHKSATIVGNVTNTNVTEAIYICEIGLWANDPDEGEILYGYANCGTYGDYYAPASQGPYSWQYEIGAAIGNAANVTAELSQLSWDYGLRNSNTSFIHLKGGNQKEINKSIDDSFKILNGTGELKEKANKSDFDNFKDETDTHLGEMENKKADKVSLDTKVNTTDYSKLNVYVPTITGTFTAYVGSISNGQTAYVDGQPFTIIPNVDCGNAPTFNFNNIGALTIVKQDGSAVSTGDIKANKPLSLVRVGSNFFIRSSGGISVKKVQHGTLGLSGSVSKTITIEKVDLNKSIIIFEQENNPNGNYGAPYIDIEAKFLNDTTIEFSRGLSASTSPTIRYQVIEFDNVKKLYTGNLQVTESYVVKSITIPTVNMKKSILVYSYKTATTNSGFSDTKVYGYLNSETTIYFTKQDNSSASTITYFLVEFN